MIEATTLREAAPRRRHDRRRRRARARTRASRTSYRGVEWWESHGYRVKLGDGVFAIDDYVAGDPEQRAADLNALFADPEVDVVQVLQGGYGSAQLIPHIDFDVIAANPKPFIGYSDITALHVAIRQRDRPRDALRLRPGGSRGQRVDAVLARPPARRAAQRTAPARSRATPTTRTCARSAPAR